MWESCFGGGSRRKRALQQENTTLHQRNAGLLKEIERKTKNCERVQNENKELQKKIVLLEAQYNVTDKVYERQVSLTADLRGKLEEYESVYKLQRRESQVLIQKSKEKDLMIDKLQKKNLEIKILEEICKKSEIKCHELQEELNSSEEKLKRVKDLIKEEKICNSLENQKMHKHLKKSNRQEIKKSKSHSDLQFLEQTDSASIHLEKDSQTYQNGLEFPLIEEHNSDDKENLLNLYKQLHRRFQKIKEILFGNSETMESSQFELYQHEMTEARGEKPDEISPSAEIEKNPQTEEMEADDLDPIVTKTLNIIEEINHDTIKLVKEVEEFVGTKEDKVYLHLNEMLVRNIMKLDNIDSQGRLIIREKRKDVIHFIQKLHKKLNHKVQLVESVKDHPLL